MNKGELIKEVAGLSEATIADTKLFVENTSTAIAAALLAGEDVTVPGIGKLKIKTREARTGRNPKTGEAISIPAKKVVKFSLASEFATLLNTAPGDTDDVNYAVAED
jgi:nucleoid DNA-binding protein